MLSVPALFGCPFVSCFVRFVFVVTLLCTSSVFNGFAVSKINRDVSEYELKCGRDYWRTGSRYVWLRTCESGCYILLICHKKRLLTLLIWLSSYDISSREFSRFVSFST